MKNIYNFSLEELENYFLSINEKKFRATQVFEWLYRNRINSFDEMTNISKNVIRTTRDRNQTNIKWWYY